MLLCAQGPCPANQAEPRAAIICPASLAQALSSAKLAMPPTAAPPIIVLPAFTRSLSADGRAGENTSDMPTLHYVKTNLSS